jgi:hypothetical protein
MGLSRNKLLWIVAGSAAAVYVGPKVFSALNRNGRLTRLFGDAAEKIDRAVGWDRLPVWQRDNSNGATLCTPQRKPLRYGPTGSA